MKPRALGLGTVLFVAAAIGRGQSAGAPASPDGAPPEVTPQATSTAASDETALTPRERELLERIETLERRLARSSRDSSPARRPSACRRATPPPAPPVVARCRRSRRDGSGRARNAGETRAVRLRGLHLADRETAARRNFRSTRRSSRARSASTPPTPTRSTTRRTTRSAARPRSSATTRSSSRELGIGGDFHCKNVRARLLTQFGMYSQTHAAQRREPGARPVEPRQRLPLHLRGLRRVPLRHAERHQHRRRASSCPTSASSATTSSTTGRISRRTSRRTRPGSSTACASRSSRATS